jgi:hypothetical protein
LQWLTLQRVSELENWGDNVGLEVQLENAVDLSEDDRVWGTRRWFEVESHADLSELWKLTQDSSVYLLKLIISSTRVRNSFENEELVCLLFVHNQNLS